MSIETYEQIVETQMIDHYLTDAFKEIGIAEKLADVIEHAILRWDETPYRGSVRRAGAFA